MQNILFIIHSSPYGDEHFFSALRLALQLQEQHKSAVNLKVFFNVVFTVHCNQRDFTKHFHHCVGLGRVKISLCIFAVLPTTCL